MEEVHSDNRTKELTQKRLQIRKHKRRPLALGPVYWLPTFLLIHHGHKGRSVPLQIDNADMWAMYLLQPSRKTEAQPALKWTQTWKDKHSPKLEKCKIHCPNSLSFSYLVFRQRQAWVGSKDKMTYFYVKSTQWVVGALVLACEQSPICSNSRIPTGTPKVGKTVTLQLELEEEWDLQVEPGRGDKQEKDGDVSMTQAWGMPWILQYW